MNIDSLLTILFTYIWNYVLFIRKPQKPNILYNIETLHLHLFMHSTRLLFLFATLLFRVFNLVYFNTEMKTGDAILFATQYYEAGCAVCGQQTTNLCKQTFDRRSKISAYIGRITVKYNPFFKGKPLLFPLLWKFSSFPQPARFFCCLWRCFGRVFVLSNIVYIAFLVRRHIEY